MIKKVIKKIINRLLLLRYSYFSHIRKFNNKERNPRIIVSLTTYPARFEYLHICLRSLLNQTIMPDKLIVWLEEGIHEEDFTEEMKKLRDVGVEFVVVTGNLKPHKKYLYVMQQFPDDIVITVDDDVVYTPFLISSLYKQYKRYPNSISARRVHKITFNVDGINLYKDWKLEYTKYKDESFQLIAIGVGGVLYPPHSLPDKAFDIEKINKLCLNADDIWLKFMECIKGVKVVWTPCFIIHPPLIAGTQVTALDHSNVDFGKNDGYVKELSLLYPVAINTIQNNKWFNSCEI